MPDVRLVDLEIIKRFSLAVRAEYGDADEVLAALDASRQAVLRALAPPTSGTKAAASAKAAAGPAAPKTAAPKQVASKPTAGKSSTARKAAVGKPSGKKAGPRKTR